MQTYVYILFKTKKMKIIPYILLLTLLLANCKKDDDGQANIAPEAFALLSVENNEERASLYPTFTWESAIDPNGDKVVYDLYLEIKNKSENVSIVEPGENSNLPDPTNIIAQGLTETSFTITNSLPLSSTFTWKVVARDNRGGRLLNLSEEPLIAAAAFDPRQGHGSVYFNDKFWIIGGFANIEDIKNDIWSSTDGENWTLETANAEFTARAHFGITTFQNKIFIIGGIENGGLLEDVWSSADGVTWLQETASTGYSPRVFTKLVSLNNKLYALGGSENFFNPNTDSTKEVWSSTNGSDWVLETSEAPYSKRFGFEALAFDDKLFVMGGALSETFEIQNDVWYSRDGENWTQVSQSENKFPARYFFNGTVFKDKIWLTGGELENEFEETYYTDIWSSDDGVFWKSEAQNARYEARFSPSFVSNEDYMLLMGGGQIGTNTKFNDVWKFD